MKNVLITGAGGSPATNFVRSLRDAPEKFNLIGVDCNKYYLERAETDKKYLIPSSDNDHYFDILNEIIEEEKIDFIHIQNDIEIGIISENREKIKTKYFLPDKETIRICLDKYESFKKWNKNGVPQPKTCEINDEEDLKNAFSLLGSKIWIRNKSGAGGNGSLPTDNFEQAKNWISFKNGWRHFMAAEYLSPDTVTWQSIWKNGKLIVAQTRKRLYWELGKVSPSGISGATGGAITTSSEMVDGISIKAIKSIDNKPNGIFSVDLTFNKFGIPIPTEINISRFFTTHYFFTKAGLNMPYIYLKEAFNEEYPQLVKKINPLENDLLWIRGMDFEPVFTSVENVNKYEKNLKQRLEKYE